MATALKSYELDADEMTSPIMIPSLAFCGLLTTAGALATQTQGPLTLDTPVAFVINATETKGADQLNDLAPQSMLAADLSAWGAKMAGGDTSHMVDF